MKIKMCVGTVLALASGAAFATQMKDVPVKCTMPDGKVTYERGSCPPGAKIEIVRYAGDAPASSSASGEWSFQKTVDSMTGKAQCLAISPTSYPYSRAPGSLPGIRVLVEVTQSRPSVRVEVRPDGTIFHHKIADSGIKVGAGTLVPFGSRPTQTRLLLAQSMDSFVVQDMLRSPDFRVRMRFWPWDELADTQSISLSGFKQAYVLAVACSG